MAPLNDQRMHILSNDSRINRLRRMRSRPNLRRTDTPNENLTVMISSDSEEEERRINQEITNLFTEFNRIEHNLSRTRARLRRLYERRETVRIRRAVRLRELELSRHFRNRWLPSLSEVQRNAFRIENNILNDINNTNNTNNTPSDDSDSDTLPDLPTADEILNQLCGPKLNVSNLNDVD